MIDTVGVVGGGFMGSGIAETTAVAGVPVIIVEADDAGAQAALARITSSLDHAHRRGKLDDAARAETLERITITTDIADVADCDLVVEAVPEIEELKTSVMSRLDQHVSEQAIIASNTSSIPIAELSATVRRPERVLGLHFFSPVPVMPLVEIVVALDTDDATVQAAREFAERVGKQAVITRDRSGFIVNMLLIPYLVAAVRMYEEGFATAEDIDVAMKLGCGHPMGPLTLCDFIGLDVIYAVCNSLFDEFKRPEYAPPPLLKRMLASGRLGRKSGKGFYDYASAS